MSVPTHLHSLVRGPSYTVTTVHSDTSYQLQPLPASQLAPTRLLLSMLRDMYSLGMGSHSMTREGGALRPPSKALQGAVPRITGK